MASFKLSSAVAALAFMLPVGAGAADVTAVPAMAPVAAPARSPLPIDGIAQVTIRVSDLERSQRYYEGVLGFKQAFWVRTKSGTASYFKINDDQYLELVPGLEPGELVRQARIVFQAADIGRLHRHFADKGIKIGAIVRDADGNRTFRITAPNGFPFDFKQYEARSRQARLRGKLLGPQRIAVHMLHAGTLVTDDATRAFLKELGLTGFVFGARGDYLETPSTDRNLETKNPPLDPQNPVTASQYQRELYGATYHFALEVADMHALREELKRRGEFDDVRLRTAVGNNRHWLIHLFDPDGSRTEFMSRDTVASDVPSFSVMPPGPPAPPILATQKGVYPWP